jgi:glycosyltransferase involved in cell wall biosynthesis
MRLAIFQRLDQEGGGSRASLLTTMGTLRELRPDWQLLLVTQNHGPLARMAEEMGVAVWQAKLPRYRKPMERLAFWLACRPLKDRIGRFKPDAVLSNEWVTSPHALQVARRLEVPSICYVRDFAAVARGGKYRLDRIDRLLCVCDSMRESLLAGGYDPNKVRTVYNPIVRPVAGLQDSAARGQIAKAADTGRWLLYLGRISRRKNQIDAVRTLQHLRDITGERWGLLLAGDADEAYAAELDRFVAAAGLEGRVLRLGMIRGPAWLFELADATIMTSRREGLARVLIESFLCAKPAFSFPLEGIEDVYGDKLGHYVPERPEPELLAEKIVAGLADPEMSRQRTEELRLMLEARHSPAGHVDAFENAIRRL